MSGRSRLGSDTWRVCRSHHTALCVQPGPHPPPPPSSSLHRPQQVHSQHALWGRWCAAAALCCLHPEHVRPRSLPTLPKQTRALIGCDSRCTAQHSNDCTHPEAHLAPQAHGMLCQYVYVSGYAPRCMCACVCECVCGNTVAWLAAGEEGGRHRGGCHHHPHPLCARIHKTCPRDIRRSGKLQRSN